MVNVTKDAIWTRQAVLPESGNFKKPTTEAGLRQMFGGQIPETMRIPHGSFGSLGDLLSPANRESRSRTPSSCRPTCTGHGS